MTASSTPLALVTGATRQAGLGTAIALALAEAGCDVAFTTFRPYDKDTSGLLDEASDAPQHLSANLAQFGRRTTHLEIDLADPESPARLFDHVEATLGPVSILVNNAAYSQNDGIAHLTADLLDRHYAVNVRGMALLCAEFVRRFQTQNRHSAGRIINLSSGQSYGPMPGELAYAASKGAVEAFTLSLSAEVASLGITVNAVDPGLTDTGWLPAELEAEWLARSPHGRLGQPTDAARLIRFLASADAEWITGQVIRSRGGM